VELRQSEKAARLPHPVRITEQVWPEGTVPVVSICCITFNHGRFVRESIEGFLMQETTFPVEIAIHDDASSDETASILENYARRCPKLFRLVLRGENQFQQSGFAFFWRFLAEARGEFVAVCEGDDHWSDPRKLQNQVEYLQSRPDAVLSCHRVRCQREGASSAAKDYRVGTDFYPDLEEAQDIPWAVLMRTNPVQTCSVVYRRSALPQIPAWFHGLAMGDWPLCLELSTKGAVHYSPEAMATYRVHDTSYWSSAKKEWILDKTHEMLRRAFCHTIGHEHGLSGHELYGLVEPVLDKRLLPRLKECVALASAGSRRLSERTRAEFLRAVGAGVVKRVRQVKGGATALKIGDRS